jgi:hypothetical protein
MDYVLADLTTSIARGVKLCSRERIFYICTTRHDSPLLDLLEKTAALGKITLATVSDPLVLTNLYVSPIGLVQFLVFR